MRVRELVKLLESFDCELEVGLTDGAVDFVLLSVYDKPPYEKSDAPNQV